MENYICIQYGFINNLCIHSFWTGIIMYVIKLSMNSWYLCLYMHLVDLSLLFIPDPVFSRNFPRCTTVISILDILSLKVILGSLFTRWHHHHSVVQKTWYLTLFIIFHPVKTPNSSELSL